MDQRTNGRMDTPSYGDARTHLKKNIEGVSTEARNVTQDCDRQRKHTLMPYSLQTPFSVCRLYTNPGGQTKELNELL